jgi:hypothetical protein
MKLANNKSKILCSIVFLIIYACGLSVYRDYGLTIDDEIYRSNGLLYKNYINDFIGSLLNFEIDQIKLIHQSFQANSLTAHPALFETMLAIISDVLKLNDSKKIYEISHLLNFTIYFFSLIILFKLIRKRCSSYISLLGVLVLFLTPRIFAESFYNTRDIFFLSLFIFFLYTIQKIINEHTYKNILYLSITSALLIITKVLGIIPFLIFLILHINNLTENIKNKKNYLKKFFLLIVLTFIFIVILWPYLWVSPMNSLYLAYTEMIKQHESLTLLNYFFGDQIISTDIPWYYRIIWFFITTPIIVILLYILGFISILSNLIKKILNLDEKNLRIFQNEKEFFDGYLLLVIVGTLFATIKFNESQYGGWRHLYFLYIPVILFSMQGVNFILKLNKKYLSNIISLLIWITLIINSIWMYNNHPYQNIFFNNIVKKYAKNNFELDYWGLSNLQSLNHILDNDKNKIIKVSTISFADLDVSKMKLDKKERKRIKIIHNYEESDYLIDTYMKRIGKNYIINSLKFRKFYEIKVNDIAINTVYKKVE